MKEIFERRSMRKYENKEIPRELIQQIIGAGLKAPSAKNRQPWKYIVLTSEYKRNFIEEMRRGIKKELATKSLLPNSSNYIPAALHTADIMEQAPALIVVCNPAGHSLYDELTLEEKIYECADIQSIGASIQNMLLEATSLGIGTLWICDIYFAYDNLKNYFNDKGEIIAAVTLGYPAEYPSERPRKDWDEVVEFQ